MLFFVFSLSETEANKRCASTFFLPFCQRERDKMAVAVASGRESGDTGPEKTNRFS